MRWLARRWARGIVLDRQEGKVLYYPVSFTGPGLILEADRWRAILGCFALWLWAGLLLLAAPTEFIGAWLGKLFGPFFDDWHFAGALWFVILALVYWLSVRRYERLISECYDRRDPADWDEDLKKLDARQGGSLKEVIVYLLALVFLSPLIGNTLDEVLMGLLAP